MNFPDLNRITIDPNVMGGKPCICGTIVTAGTITGLVASSASFDEIFELYPYLEKEDIKAALSEDQAGRINHNRSEKESNPFITLKYENRCQVSQSDIK